MNNKFSENLKKIRKENNLSQEELADQLGVSRQAISKWESGTAYPEMDKIISLCEKFNVNMDDLLYKDIKEVKGEEEAKKKINKYIEDFLKFISDSFNLFINMSFGNKVKLLLEELIIGLFLFFVSSLFFNVTETFFEKVFSFLSPRVKGYVIGVLSSFIVLAVFILCIAIMAYVFKTRYLDYYQKFKEENKEEDDSKDKKKDKKVEKDELKTELKDNTPKIVIRDPKRTEYRFIKGLLKLIVFGIKFFVLLISIFLSFILIGLFAAFIGSFLIIKTGLFFVGISTGLLSCSLMVIVFLVLFLNFILNRKSDKKLLIMGFIISLIGIGIGAGLTGAGSLNFKTGTNNEGMLKEEEVELPMKDNSFIYQDYYKIEYIEENRKDIKVGYTFNENCKLSVEQNNNAIYGQIRCDYPFEIGESFIKNVNNNMIVPITSDIDVIKVYASKENIKKLKDNYNKYQEDIKKEQEKRDQNLNKIDELSKENKELTEKVRELEKELNKNKNK